MPFCSTAVLSWGGCTGVLVTEPAGSTRITVERGPGTESFEPTLYVRGAGSGYAHVVELGRKTEALVDNMTPGEYEAIAYTDGMVRLHGKVTVVAGETADLLLKMRAGARCSFAVTWPEGRTSGRRKYRILDDAGELFHEFDGALGSASTDPLSFSLHIPAGTWNIAFSTDNGLRGEAKFAVVSATEAVQINFDLK